MLSSRCFVCRQSKQQLEEEQKKALYGLENAGNLCEYSLECGSQGMASSGCPPYLPLFLVILCCVSFSSSSRQQRVTAALEMLGHLDIRDKAFDCCHKADQSQGIAVPAAMEYGLAGTLFGLG